MKKMQENQEGNYFTPTIEELHVGYQCKVFDMYEKQWEDFVVTKDYCLGVLSQWIEFKELRTPFLTKEQIEAEGWKHIGGKLISSAAQLFSLTQDWKSKRLEDAEYSYHLELKQKNSIPYIVLSWNDLRYIPYEEGLRYRRTNIPLYEGECYSVNEFRNLMKWLKVKK